VQCVGEFPLLKSLQQQFGDKGLALVGVSVDKVCDRAREAVQKHGLSWPQLCDGKALKGEIMVAYNVDVTPTYYVIGRDGLIAGKRVQAEELQAFIEKALAAPAAAPAPGKPGTE
jgi:peroxiredoxin